MARKRIVSVVERGWRGARECANAANAAGAPVIHLIKGRISPQVREMIGPTPQQQVVAWPRPLFYLGLWCWLVPRALLGRVRWVLVDHERTYRGLSRWGRWCGVTPVTIREGEEGWTLWRGDARVPLDALVGPAA